MHEPVDKRLWVHHAASLHVCTINFFQLVIFGTYFMDTRTSEILLYARGLMMTVNDYSKIQRSIQLRRIALGTLHTGYHLHSSNAACLLRLLYVGNPFTIYTLQERQFLCVTALATRRFLVCDGRSIAGTSRMGRLEPCGKRRCS